MTHHILVGLSLATALMVATPERAAAYCAGSGDTCPTASASLYVATIGTAGNDGFTIAHSTVSPYNIGYCSGSTWTEFNFFDNTGNIGKQSTLTHETALCFLGGNDVIVVKSDADSYCGTVLITAFPYNGHRLELWGQTGADTLQGGGGADQLCGGSGGDTLLGGNGDDDVDGYSDNDLCDGQLGNYDTVWGYSGADYVLDQAGQHDQLNGEADNESCVFDADGSYDWFACGAGTDNYQNSGSSGIPGTGSVSADCDGTHGTCYIY